MSDDGKDSLGDRMKRYEDVARLVLTPRMPMVIRVDGRAFHTYTRGFERPWDIRIRDAMTDAAVALCKTVSGAKIAYLQSDEISVVVTDYDRLDSQPWFGKSAQKICSVAASVATAAFNETSSSWLWLHGRQREATFDARCFVLPIDDVNNYFLWRQRDSTRNSIAMLGQSLFSHRQLQGKTGSEIQNMMMLERNVNWNDRETWEKRGWCVVRESYEVGLAIRSRCVPDWEIPIFSKDTGYIERNMKHAGDEETSDADT